MKLSIVIPIYNEKETLRMLFERVRQAPYDKEIILVEDCSTDGTREIVKMLAKEDPSLKCVFHDKNMGKGKALASGFKEVSGDVVIIQDADLEYDPAEYPVILAPILDGRADVVYGSRFLGSPQRVHLFWHFVGNRMFTLFSNIFTNINLNDMETCYKAFKASLLSRFSIRSRRFGVEPEITAKFARMKCKIYEVAISYSGRDYSEGKKIGWKDGLAAFYWIIYYNLINRKMH